MFVLMSKYIFDSSPILNSQKILRKINCAVFHKNKTWKKYSNDASLHKTNESVPETNNNSSNISDGLVKWAVQNNVTHYTFTKLLKILREYGIKDLPLTSATMLLAKEANVNVVKMLPGIYTHFGLQKNLLILMETLIEKNIFTGTDISVSVFVDEVPDLKTINQNLWVILGLVEGFMNNVFFIGAYLGFSKPKNSNLFLSEFVKEAKHLTTEGLKINDIKYNVKIKRLICDSPAKSFVLNIKNFSGYSSCTKCHATGEYENKRLCFLEKGSPRRDIDFEKNEIYQSEKTCLLKIPNFGVVSNVTIDYMHLVCLGVVKKLLSFWSRDEYFWSDKKYAFSKFKSLSVALPCEFHAKNKYFNLDNLHSAYDLRNFLLYYGPFTLKDALNKPYYENFLNLHIACRLLCTEASVEYIYFGRRLLDNFVEEYKTLYKPEQITYNVHGLYHLPDDCYSHGILDNFSSFPFEKFLCNLRNTMQRNKKRIIPQTILKESYEKIFIRSLEKLSCNNFSVKYRVNDKEIKESKNFHQYDKMYLRNYKIISSSQSDNHVFLKNGKIIKVTGIYKNKTENKYFIAGNEFVSSCNFHLDKFKSLKLGTFIINKQSSVVKKWPIDLLDTKGMVLPMENDSSLIIRFLDNNF